MIAVSAMLLCSAPGCGRRCEVLAKVVQSTVAHESMGVTRYFSEPRLVPVYPPPDGWTHDKATNMVRCPDHAEVEP